MQLAHDGHDQGYDDGVRGQMGQYRRPGCHPVHHQFYWQKLRIASERFLVKSITGGAFRKQHILATDQAGNRWV
jgi:hypothetical protein